MVSPLQSLSSSLSQKVSLRDFTWQFFNMMACAAIAFFLFNFAYAPWTWNPIEDLLYVRDWGFLLPANHMSSGLSIAITAAVFAWTNFSSALKTTFVILSTVSIHEYLIFFISMGGFAPYDLTMRWIFWLGIVLTGGIIFATKSQRKIMLTIMVFMTIYTGWWLILRPMFNIDARTIIGYFPGPAYTSFIPNFWEVSSWLGCASAWWIARWKRMW